MEINTKYRDFPEEYLKDEFELSVWRNKNCTEKVKKIDFGPIEPGKEKSRWVWIKNTGQVILPEICVGMGIIDGEGWKSRTDGYLEGPLEVGEKNQVPFRLKVEPEAKIGKYSGEIPITVYGQSNSHLGNINQSWGNATQTD